MGGAHVVRSVYGGTTSPSTLQAQAQAGARPAASARSASSPLDAVGGGSPTAFGPSAPPASANSAISHISDGKYRQYGEDDSSVGEQLDPGLRMVSMESAWAAAMAAAVLERRSGSGGGPNQAGPGSQLQGSVSGPPGADAAAVAAVAQGVLLPAGGAGGRAPLQRADSAVTASGVASSALGQASTSWGAPPTAGTTASQLPSWAPSRQSSNLHSNSHLNSNVAWQRQRQLEDAVATKGLFNRYSIDVSSLALSRYAAGTPQRSQQQQQQAAVAAAAAASASPHASAAATAEQQQQQAAAAAQLQYMYASAATNSSNGSAVGTVAGSVTGQPPTSTTRLSSGGATNADGAAAVATGGVYVDGIPPLAAPPVVPPSAPGVVAAALTAATATAPATAASPSSPGSAFARQQQQHAVLSPPAVARHRSRTAVGTSPDSAAGSGGSNSLYGRHMTNQQRYSFQLDRRTSSAGNHLGPHGTISGPGAPVAVQGLQLHRAATAKPDQLLPHPHPHHLRSSKPGSAKGATPAIAIVAPSSPHAESSSQIQSPLLQSHNSLGIITGAPWSNLYDPSSPRPSLQDHWLPMGLLASNASAHSGIMATHTTSTAVSEAGDGAHTLTGFGAASSPSRSVPPRTKHSGGLTHSTSARSTAGSATHAHGRPGQGQGSARRATAGGAAAAPSAAAAGGGSVPLATDDLRLPPDHAAANRIKHHSHTGMVQQQQQQRRSPTARRAAASPGSSSGGAAPRDHSLTALQPMHLAGSGSRSAWAAAGSFHPGTLEQVPELSSAEQRSSTATSLVMPLMASSHSQGEVPEHVATTIPHYPSSGSGVRQQQQQQQGVVGASAVPEAEAMLAGSLTFGGGGSLAAAAQAESLAAAAQLWQGQPLLRQASSGAQLPQVLVLGHQPLALPSAAGSGSGTASATETPIAAAAQRASASGSSSQQLALLQLGAAAALQGTHVQQASRQHDTADLGQGALTVERSDASLVLELGREIYSSRSGSMHPALPALGGLRPLSPQPPTDATAAASAAAAAATAAAAAAAAAAMPTYGHTSGAAGTDDGSSTLTGYEHLEDYSRRHNTGFSPVGSSPSNYMSMPTHGAMAVAGSGADEIGGLWLSGGGGLRGSQLYAEQQQLHPSQPSHRHRHSIDMSAGRGSATGGFSSSIAAPAGDGAEGSRGRGNLAPPWAAAGGAGPGAANGAATAAAFGSAASRRRSVDVPSAAYYSAGWPGVGPQAHQHPQQAGGGGAAAGGAGLPPAAQVPLLPFLASGPPQANWPPVGVSPSAARAPPPHQQAQAAAREGAGGALEARAAGGTPAGAAAPAAPAALAPTAAAAPSQAGGGGEAQAGACGFNWTRAGSSGNVAGMEGGLNGRTGRPLSTAVTLVTLATFADMNPGVAAPQSVTAGGFATGSSLEGFATIMSQPLFGAAAAAAAAAAAPGGTLGAAGASAAPLQGVRTARGAEAAVASGSAGADSGQASPTVAAGAGGGGGGGVAPTSGGRRGKKDGAAEGDSGAAASPGGPKKPGFFKKVKAIFS